MDHILQTLPNGGAVVAIIAVVMLFHKQQAARDAREEVIVRHFLAALEQARGDYLESLEKVVGGRPRPPRGGPGGEE